MTVGIAPGEVDGEPHIRFGEFDDRRGVADRTPGHTISLEIRGDIKLLPVPEPIYVKTNVDLETGHCELAT